MAAIYSERGWQSVSRQCPGFIKLSNELKKKKKKTRAVFCNIPFSRFIAIYGITVFENIYITYHRVNILVIVVLLKLGMLSNLYL